MSMDSAAAIKAARKDSQRLIGLHYGERDDPEDVFVNYDIGELCCAALDALGVAVLAIEQIVTGEKLIVSLDIGDFYRYVERAIAVENGEGIESEAGDMPGLQDEIQSLRDIIRRARMVAEEPQPAEEEE